MTKTFLQDPACECMNGSRRSPRTGTRSAADGDEHSALADKRKSAPTPARKHVAKISEAGERPWRYAQEAVDELENHMKAEGDGVMSQGSQVGEGEGRRRPRRKRGW